MGSKWLERLQEDASGLTENVAAQKEWNVSVYMQQTLANYTEACVR